MKKLYNFLVEYNKKFILYYEIERFLNIDKYDEIYNIINDLISKKTLIPVKNSKDNGKFPALKEKYKINIIQDKSILYSYDNKKINIRYYLNHFEKFHKDKKVIDIIYNFLKFDSYEISLKERALELFGHEKAFEDKNIIEILNRINIDPLKDLNCFKDREPFSFFVFNKKIKKVLICENQASFYNFYKMNKEDNKTIFDLVIFGAGNRILKTFEFVKEFVEDENVKYYYWGDIDIRGINIFCSLKEKYNKENITIWEKAYDFMLDKNKKRKNIILKKEKLNIIDYKRFNEIEKLINAKYMIPQESINYYELKDM